MSENLQGMEYLWEIMLQARNTVSRLATLLWVDILSNPHTAVISDFAHLIQMVVGKWYACKLLYMILACSQSGYRVTGVLPVFVGLK